jgi:hypothetical protein
MEFKFIVVSLLMKNNCIFQFLNYTSEVLMLLFINISLTFFTITTNFLGYDWDNTINQIYYHSEPDLIKRTI